MEDSNSYSSFNDESLEKLKQTERAKWTKEQDLFIQSMVEMYGTSDWNVVADNVNKKFPGTFRSSRQCRLRWQKYIHPLLIKHPWSEKEEAELLLAHRKFKNRWSDISNALHGRKSNSIKNRFYTIFRKVKNKIKKNDYSFVSNAEALQIHYVLSVMKNDNLAQKTGKDFIYKLMQHVTSEMLEAYSVAFQEAAVACGTMQQLFEQILSESEPAKIVLPEESSEEAKELVVPEAASPTQPMPMETESPCKPEILMAKDPSPFENIMLGPPSATMHKYSPCILSAGPAAAAEAAAKAPCFQTEPDDLGFSDFTEKEWQANQQNEPKESAFSGFYKAFTNMSQEQAVCYPLLQSFLI
eukprot:TRINITY_DN2023_c0_g1_i2.p1 TRINITY_DN2023_c0_g1~~TRINITY_DN2023_c0_g1_i2.p1  ORF type:complete len:412 (-),score=99.02 TRINITY_DN2023_c0_g1_i2:107-1171(-)